MFFYLGKSTMLGAMNNLLKLPATLTRSRGLILLLTPDQAHGSLTELIAVSVLQGPLFVVAGGEWLPAYALSRIVRQHTLEVKPVLNRLRTVRASTCYRLFDSLSTLPPQGEPLLVLDVLHTFYDDDLSLHSRLFKLRECCRELKRLSLKRIVVVMTQACAGADYEKFLPALTAIADQTCTLEAEPILIQQPALF